jgi:predicted dehydrogenase
MAKQFGVAILGTGDVSGEHIKAYQGNPYTEVRAILSRDAARAEAKARECNLPNCRAYTDLDELLRNDEIHIVSVCTPHHLHVDQGVACAEAGRHILVEKPIAIDLQGLRRLEAAVRDNKVRSLAGFVLRWNPLYETIQQILADGMLGDLYYAEVDYLHGITANYRLYPWLRQKEFGASALLTGGCHAVDGLRCFINREAVEVFSYANTSKGNPLNYEYEPNSVVLVKFDDGTVGKVTTSIEFAAPYKFNISLMGNRGAIRDNRLFTRHWPGQKDWAEIPTVLPDSPSVTHHAFVPQIRHFVDCIREGKESHCNIADAVKTHEICLAAELSSSGGKPIALPLA